MYRVVLISHPDTGQVFYIAREKEIGYGRYVLSHLMCGAKRGDIGLRFDTARSIIKLGKLPRYSVEAANLGAYAAKDLVNKLRTEHGLTTTRRGIPNPRVHRRADPNSPLLDISPIYYVYELIRPDTWKVFYVGKGSDRHQARVDAHIREAKQGKRGHKCSIIRRLLSRGLRPEENRVYENLCESDALKKEVELIAHYGLEELSNVADGGQTAPTGDNHWTRKHPEKVLRGESHPWAKDPELAERSKRAMQSALRADPSKHARGERHGMAKLTEQQVHEIRRLYQEDKVLGKDLAVKFDITPAQISRVLRGGWGLPNLLRRHGNAKLTPEQLDQIKARRAAGDGYTRIARDFGVTQNAIFCICNPGPPNRPNLTDRPGNAKLDSAQVQSMLRMYLAGGITQDELARKFDISRSQVIRIFHANGIRRAPKMPALNQSTPSDSA